METKNRIFKKVTAFILVQAMVLGGLGFTGWGSLTAYGADAPASSHYVTVRIEGNGLGVTASDSAIETVLPETIVDLDDLSGTPSAADAVDYALSGAGLTVSEKSAGSGLYTTFGGVGAAGQDYWRFSLNDESAPDTLDNIEIDDGDKIVLDITDGDWTQPTFNNDPYYSFFKVIQCEPGVDWGYPKADVKLALYQVVNDNAPPWSYTLVPVADAEITGTGSWTPVLTDSENGIAEFSLYGSDTAAGTYRFDISSDESGITKPYCRIVLTFDGTNPPDVYVSQPMAADTGIHALELDFSGLDSGISAMNYLGADAGTLTVGNSMDAVTFSALDVAAGAAAAVRHQPAGGSLGEEEAFGGGGVGYPLSEGVNTFKITVRNGDDQEIHTLKIERSSSDSTTDTDVAAVIAGIRDINDSHGSSYYTNDWVLGMYAAGIEVTAAEKDCYLANVLDLVADGSTSVAAKAKTAIALTSMNIDARQIPDQNTGATINLIDQVSAYTGSVDPAYDAPFLLSLYDLGTYSISADAAITRQDLIDTILSAQEPEGSWYQSYGSDATGMVLPALAPYYGAEAATNGISAVSCAAVTQAVNDALTYLSEEQGFDGSFPGYGGSPNSNTMIANIVGLNALGINPDTDSRFIKNGRSAMQNLLTYQTVDHKLGYQNHTSANDLACQQGLGALAAYQNLSNERSSNLYHFSEATAPYTRWPNADLLTSIRIDSAPANTVYSYDEDETDYPVDTAGLAVTAVYNGDAANTTSVEISSCILSSIDRSVSGTQTVTVTYQGCTAKFLVTVQNTGAPIQEDTVSVRVKSSSGTLASDSSMVIEAGETTALDVLKTLLDRSRVDYVINGGTYVSEIGGLGEFDKGENSGWLYSVNGKTPSDIAASEYPLDDGDVVLWYYTLDYTRDTSSSEWSESTEPIVETAAGTGTLEIAATVDANGKAAASFAEEDVSAAITAAMESAKKAENGARTEVQIVLSNTGTATSLEAKLSGSSVRELNNNVDALTVKSSVADISFDSDALNTLAQDAGGSLSITASRLDASSIPSLTGEQKAEIGNRPVFDFTVQSGSKNITQFDGKVTVSVPYTPGGEEQEAGIVVYYIGDNGELNIVKDCVYDPETKRMVFSVSHFSGYALGYQSFDFQDVNGHWAGTCITYLAARDVIRGMSDTSFSPNSNITRAQFVQILANLAGAEEPQNGAVQLPFTDVSGNAWYAQAAAWASETGIVTGVVSQDGSVRFNPNTNITRQDMAVMISRFAEKTGLYELKQLKDSVAFADDADISGYARSSVSVLQQAGLLNGKTSSVFAPNDHATRAESAKIISSLIQNSL